MGFYSIIRSFFALCPCESSMPERVSNFISASEFETHLFSAAELLEKFPSITTDQIFSIVKGESFEILQINSDCSNSEEQLDCLKKYIAVINNANSPAASNKDKAVAEIYKCAILFNVLPESITTLLVNAIQQKHHFLDLSNSNINDEQALAISLILPCTQITEINLYNNNIKGAGALSLAKCRFIRALNLGKNNITNDDIAKAFTTNSFLEELNLDESHFTFVGHEALASHDHLRKLSLYKSHVGANAAQILALQSNFDSLNLGNNDIDDNIAKKLALTTLKILDLRDNKIGDVGALMFINNKKLAMLILSNNLLSGKVAWAFAANPNLTVDITHNENVNIADIETMYAKNPITGFNSSVKAQAKDVEIPSLLRLCLFAVKQMLITNKAQNASVSSVKKLAVPDDLKDRLNQYRM